MKQTAVDWLVEKIKQANPTFKFDALIREAKAMEKEQIMDAFDTGEIQGVRSTNNYYYSSLITASKYYNKTFKSE